MAACDSAEGATRDADVIVLATGSPSPVIDATWVKPGAQVISIGACRPHEREIDPDLVASAKLFVDSRESALMESGDVVLGIEEGRFNANHIIGELGELIAGTVDWRRDKSDITVLKPLGLAVEDVTAADMVYRQAVARGIGVELR